VLFAGAPRDSLDHFQVGAYDEIYDAIDLAELPDPTSELPLPRQSRARTRLSCPADRSPNKPRP
jgi:hypothetical protein